MAAPLVDNVAEHLRVVLEIARRMVPIRKNRSSAAKCNGHPKTAADNTTVIVEHVLFVAEGTAAVIVVPVAHAYAGGSRQMGGGHAIVVGAEEIDADDRSVQRYG